MEPQPITHREELLRRLMKALEHLPYKTQMSIVASFIPLNDLERIVKFQEEDRASWLRGDP